MEEDENPTTSDKDDFDDYIGGKGGGGEEHGFEGHGGGEKHVRRLQDSTSSS